MQRALGLVQRVCDIAAPRNYLADLQQQLAEADITAAVASHDTPRLYRWLMDSVSYQGIADRIASDYLERHGSVDWTDLAAGVGRSNLCPKLASYWTFHGCGFRKWARSCGLPQHLDTCIVGALPTRNGRLAQTAASLYLFLRDVCHGDFVSWIDGCLATSADGTADAIVAALRHIHGVSDKVLSLALTQLLLGARPENPVWQAAGARLVVVDTLVHNWLHRTGILNDLIVPHAYGSRCYGPNGCADFLRQTASLIDARHYGLENPADFPRLVQFAIWRFCGADAFDICNGNRIDDSRPCDGVGCPIAIDCRRVSLRTSTRG